MRIQTDKNYMTDYAFQKLNQELDQLVKVERPETTKVVAWAASLGDRSENADYQYGKKKLREIDRRIAFLRSRLEKASVVKIEDIQTEKVQFGAQVGVVDENENKKIFYIVGEDETFPKLGIISWKSPIGKSLLGRVVGDFVTIRAPGGDHEMEIISIEYAAIPFPKDEK